MKETIKPSKQGVVLLKKVSFTVLLSLVVFSCAKVFYSPDAKVLAQRQQIIAIVPPSVSIPANKKIDVAAMKEQQQTESINLQQEMYSWLLRRKMQGRFSPEIQDVVTTNARLKEAGYPERPLAMDDLCEVLGVDGVLTSNFALSKPVSEGAAIAVGVIFGLWTTTNEVRAVLNINDCESRKLIWNFEHKVSGSVGSSIPKIVNGIMRSASKKMPYSSR